MKTSLLLLRSGSTRMQTEHECSKTYLTIWRVYVIMDVVMGGGESQAPTSMVSVVLSQGSSRGCKQTAKTPNPMSVMNASQRRHHIALAHTSSKAG